MKEEFTGMHRMKFVLSDEGKPGPASTTYDVTLVIGLYDADEVARLIQKKQESESFLDISMVEEEES